MRLMLILLVAISGVACVSAPEHTALPNPLAKLKPGEVVSVHAAYQMLADRPALGPGDIVITCSDCRQQYRYVRCTMVSVAIDQFVQTAALARPLVSIGQPAELLYFLDIEFGEGPPLSGYLFANGEMHLANNAPSFVDGRAYLLDQAALKSMLALIKGPKWTCDKTIITDMEFAFPVLVSPAQSQ